MVQESPMNSWNYRIVSRSSVLITGTTHPDLTDGSISLNFVSMC